MMHQQFYQLKSRNPEYVKIRCNDRNKPYLLAIRKRMINQ